MPAPPAQLGALAVGAVDSTILYGLIQLSFLTLVVVLYGHRAMTLSWKGRPVPGWKLASFAFGLTLTAVPLLTPLGNIADELVLAHMIEHLIIGDIAPIFLVLGLTRSMLQPLLSIRVVDRLKVLAHPAVALPLWCVNLYFWHIPMMYEGATGDTALHVVEHASFVFFGCLLWMPVFGPLPMPAWFGPGWTIVYTLITRFAGAALGNFLMWSGTVLYPAYAEGQAAWGIDPIADQSTAGAIMMVVGVFVGLPVLAYSFLRVAKQGTERQELLDLAYDLGVPLDEERAQRAVAAGQGEALRNRIQALSGSGDESLDRGTGEPDPGDERASPLAERAP